MKYQFYYDPHSRSIQRPAQLTRRFPGKDDAFLSSIGIHQLVILQPVYDEYTQKLADPGMAGITWDGVRQSYVQTMAVVELSEEEVAAAFEKARAAKLAEINEKNDVAVKELVATYPEMELLTFDKQEAEARAWQADNAAATPLVDALAAGRSIDKAELVSRIIAKADQFALASGYLIGVRQGYEDALKTCTTAAEVVAIEPVYDMEAVTAYVASVTAG